jgi:AcrR family transcriptional regulator
MATETRDGGSARRPAFEDLTARARIRDAALGQFAEHGFERATIRGIASAAGVSPGLVRHHFGSKQALRDAVDAHVLQEIRRISDEVMEGSQRRDLSRSMLSREALIPFQGYLMHALMDGSAIIASMFDQMVELTEQWVALRSPMPPIAWPGPPWSPRWPWACRCSTSICRGCWAWTPHPRRGTGGSPAR